MKAASTGSLDLVSKLIDLGAVVNFANRVSGKFIFSSMYKSPQKNVNCLFYMSGMMPLVPVTMM